MHYSDFDNANVVSTTELNNRIQQIYIGDAVDAFSLIASVSAQLSSFASRVVQAIVKGTQASNYKTADA